MDINKTIIKMVKENECLYNLASKSYKNVQKKKEIWDTIGDMVNLSGEACRKRWKGLRDTYKRRKRLAHLAAVPSKKWKYMEALQFLDNYKDARATIRSVENTPVKLESLLDCSSSTDYNERTDDSTPQQLNEVRPKKYTKKHADAEVSSVLKDVMKVCADSVKELASASFIEKDRNSTTLLFESLAKKVLEANLPQKVVSRIETKVMNLVYEEVAQNLRS